MTREEAIKWVDDRMCWGRGTFTENHPPNIDECWKAGSMAIEALKAEPNDFIPRAYYEKVTSNMAKKIVELELALEERTGEWVVTTTNTTHWYVCNRCGGAGDAHDKYCKHCGTKMGGK